MSKRDRWSMLLLSAVIILLPIAAALQYRWLGRVSEAEQERMRAVLRSAAAQFSESFDGEMTRAYALFQHERGADLAQIADQYVQRLDDWHATAAHPEMLRELYVVIATEGAPQLMRCDRDARRLESVDWPEELAALRDPREIVSDFISEEIPALVIPSEPDAAILATVVLLDRAAISNNILPELANRFFAGAGGNLQYDVAVVSQRDRSRVIFATTNDLARGGAKVDAVSALFDVRLETLPIRAPESATQQRSANRGTTMFRVIKRRIGAGATDESSGRWQLLVRHRAGSLEAAVNAGRRRNLAISFAVLLLLGASVGFIVLSSRRATRLAEDQLKFVAAVTHELRTPLAVICSAGENLADGVVGERAQAKEYGAVIRDEGRRLSRMVEQVMDYAGAQFGKSVYNFQSIDIRSVIDAAVEECGEQLTQGSFQLQRDIEQNLPLVNADAEALQRAVQNLVTNALKYASDSRWIRISARRQRGETGADEVQVTVEDRGPGIAITDLPHIFDAFYRGADVVAAQVKGFGLGLSLVQHIVAAHGGHVAVESTRGSGSVFTIHLPVANSA